MSAVTKITEATSPTNVGDIHDRGACDDEKTSLLPKQDFVEEENKPRTLSNGEEPLCTKNQTKAPCRIFYRKKR
jgi:hypothetical protein